jgi:transposase
MTKTPKKKKLTAGELKALSVLHPNTAGIDIGSRSHHVAVPADRDPESVKEFQTFTADLKEMVKWLRECKIQTIIMESTGVYWIPIYEMLEQNGFEVKLVNARHVKNVSAHKTDVMDCQWLQQLGTYGLLKGAFRPKDEILPLRSYLRQREMLIKSAATHIQHMQKALNQMNVQIHHVVSDITGTTGMAIIRDIVKGNTDPKTLAAFRDPRCHNPKEVIEASLVGNYREEHVFSLKQALELYDFYIQKIVECDIFIEKAAKQLESYCDPDKLAYLVAAGACPKKKRKSGKHSFSFDLSQELIRISGVDLVRLPGIGASTALTVISELGIDMSPWPSIKHFASWLGLSPGNKVSGGKRLSGKTKSCSNRVATALRMAASTLYASDCAYGAFLRRMKTRLGAPKAITALAHKLARQIYLMLKYGYEYVEKGVEAYEANYREKQEKNLRRKAKELGYVLTPIAL